MQQRNTELIRFQVFCWKTAVDNRLETVGSSVMAVALLGSGPNSVTKLLDVMNVDVEKLSTDLTRYLEITSPKRRPKKVEHETVVLSDGGREVMKIAGELCEFMDDFAIGPHHVLLAILKFDPRLTEIFNKHGVTFPLLKKLTKEVLSIEPSSGTEQSTEIDKKEKVAEGTKPNQPVQQKQGINEKEILTKYCRNLTLLASQGKLDPVVGRDKEISRLAMTLGRRKKNNAILVGDPGVGKTAVVEGLAQRIVQGSVSGHAKTCQIFQLNMTAVVSKTTFRGQFEERMRAIVDLFSSNKDYVLFVDEMHTLIGAGGSVGGLDAANILKPALAGGDIRCIGATTEDEYRRYFKKDGALDRRFQRIFIDEPTKEETLQILIGVKSMIETHHNCSIPDDVLKLAVDLVVRHVPDRRLPDKAIDCIDEACATAAACSSGGKFVVTQDNIVSAVASQTNMPKEIVGVSDSNRAIKLADYLKKFVVGQDEAIDQLSTFLLSSYLGIRDHNRPIGCLMFGGPSGSGTTFMAEKMAEALFDGDESLIRINMSEFSEKFGNTRLIGSPPGYVGYGDKNQLTDRVSRKPYCLILLDGIEGASEDVIRLFVQAMSKGVVTDASGKDVSFRNAVVIMTTTFNAASKSSKMGFADDEVSDSEAKRDALIDECRKRFGDDFVNKVDDFVAFNALNKSHIRLVAEIHLEQLRERLEAVGTVLRFSDETVDAVASGSFKGNQTTVKDVDRFIRKVIEPTISKRMACGHHYSCLSLEMENDHILCSPCQDGIECSVAQP